MAAGALGCGVEWDLEFHEAQVVGEVRHTCDSVEPLNFGNVGVSTAFLLVTLCPRMWLFKLGALSV